MNNKDYVVKAAEALGFQIMSLRRSKLSAPVERWLMGKISI